MDWTAQATFRMVIGLVGVAAAGLVMLGGRRRPANWLLAAILLGSGIGPGGILRSLQDAGVSMGGIDMDGGPTFRVIVNSIPFLYALFIGLAIHHPAVTWLRHRATQLVLFITWAVAIVFSLIEATATATTILVAMAALATAVLALIAAIGQLRRSEGVARSRALWYVGAFAVRDAALILLTVANIVFFAGEHVRSFWFDAGRVLLATSDVLLVGALMRGQILDFDHRLLRAGSSAMAAALLVAAFVVATEIVEGVLSGGDQVIGILTAVVLALAFRPIQSAIAGRLQRRLPHAKPIDAMSLSERRQLYDEQVRLAHADGVVTSAEEEMLARLQVRLGLGRASLQ